MTNQFQTLETIRFAMDGAVAKITLNRPQRLNAAPPQMFTEIHQVLKALPGLGARALLLTGEGRAFCSGADLQANAAANANAAAGAPASAGATAGATAAPAMTRGERSYKSLTESYSPTMLALSKLSIPVVTAVNGAAAGIGCSLALAGDFTLAAKSAYFLQAFVNIGLVPDGGSSWMLARLVGKARASEMMMLGERISAEKAEAWGLIYRAVEDADLQALALALAQRLASGPSLALGLMRQGLADALEQSYADALHAEAKHQSIAANSADASEGGQAFLQRRKAVFSGK
jgi:2-(1,2-epoxy-1,2-dihydrophenyl)acetyl-CoA isomerase